MTLLTETSQRVVYAARHGHLPAIAQKFQAPLGARCAVAWKGSHRRSNLVANECGREVCGFDSRPFRS